MDSNAGVFRPHNGDAWLVQNELHHVQSIQADHSDRLSRLERKFEEDARMKSVWGGASPFPSAFSSTPQHTPLPQPSTSFRSFDDDASHVMAASQLDSEEEPRRLGPTSRANSVRFDESANQGHWAHASRSSFDFMPRGGAAGGAGLTMHERSSSHKSEGRASSVHSIRSAASGRASSITLDNGFSLGDSARSPIGTPILAPGLLVLGTVPAIIRCWMNADFKHDALLYAAVCTGSHKSYIDMSLLQNLGLTDRAEKLEDDTTTISLPVYLPEAIPHPASSSRSNSPVPQLPTVTVTFQITNTPIEAMNPKGIRIVIGSDALRLHSADVLFSTNTISLFDDDRSKLSVPLVRPEEERVFKSLQTMTRANTESTAGSANAVRANPLLNGLGQREQRTSNDRSMNVATGESTVQEKYRPPAHLAADSDDNPEEPPRDVDRPASGSTSRPGTPWKSGMTSSRLGSEDAHTHDTDEEVQAPSSSRSASVIAAKASWRQDGIPNASGPGHSPAASTSGATPAATSGAHPDWASKFKDLSSQTRKRDGGIKILRPMKSVTSRNVSSASAGTGTPPGPWAVASPSSPPPPAADPGRSRFFDDGRRKVTGSTSNANADPPRTPGPETVPGEAGGSSASATDGGTAAPSGRRANPVGGGSAFAWLDPGSVR